MEATTEAQADVASPVPRRDDDGPGERRRVDAGLESGRAPADLDRDIHAAPVGQFEHGVDEVDVHAKRVVRARGGGCGPTSLVQVRGHDRGRSGPPKEHRDQQANDALAGHEDRFSEPRVGVEHHRDRRLEVRGEHPDVGWEAFGQPDRKVGRHDVLGLMRVVHKDEVVHRQLRDARADLDHAADARVGELDREAEVAADGREIGLQLARGAAAIDEELAPGTHPGDQRADPDVVGSDGRGGFLPDLHSLRPAEPDGLRHHLRSGAPARRRR